MKDAERKSTAWILAGATATGKSAVAQLLAEKTERAILSADSMLVYKGMDIGTAKPMTAERGQTLYAGIDLVTPAEPFSTGLWLKAAQDALDLRTEAAQPAWIVVGGTGLYLKALTEGLDAAASNPARRAHWQEVFDKGGLDALRAALAGLDAAALARLGEDAANPRRVIRALELAETGKSVFAKAPPRARFAVLRMPREALHRRIAARVEGMFRKGLLAEVEALRKKYPIWSQTAAEAIGYAEALAVLEGRLSPGEAKERIAIRTNQLAKKQETWFRHQADPIWIDIGESDPPETVAEKVRIVWEKYGPNTVTDK